MEEELGYQLFDREGKRIRLNDAGKEWLKTVLQMRELYENTRLKLEEKHEMQHPEVSIYIGCASTLLPGLLQYLRKRNPGIQYQIHQWNITDEKREKHIQILAENPGWGETKGTADMAEAEGAAITEMSCILMEEQIVLALPAQHPLVGKTEITLKDLEKEEFIYLNSNWALSRNISREMEKLRFTPRVTMWVDNPNLMRELLRAHMGITFVPAVTWHSFAGEEVVMRPVKGCNMKRGVVPSNSAAYLSDERKEGMYQGN